MFGFKSTVFLFSSCTIQDFLGGLGREEEMATHSSILAGKFHGQKILAGTVHGGHKESDTTEQLTLSHLYYQVLKFVSIIFFLSSSILVDFRKYFIPFSSIGFVFIGSVIGSLFILVYNFIDYTVITVYHKLKL